MKEIPIGLFVAKGVRWQTLMHGSGESIGYQILYGLRTQITQKGMKKTLIRRLDKTTQKDIDPQITQITQINRMKKM